MTFKKKWSLLEGSELQGRHICAGPKSSEQGKAGVNLKGRVYLNMPQISWFSFPDKEGIA